MSSKSHKLALNLDSIGLTASMICAVHCAFFPLFLLALTYYGLDFAAGPLFEFFLIFLSILIGIYTFTHGYRNHHRSMVPLLTFLGGLSVVLVSHYVFHESAHKSGFSPEFIFSPIGAMLIGAGHYLNRKLTRQVAANQCCK